MTCTIRTQENQENYEHCHCLCEKRQPQNTQGISLMESHGSHMEFCDLGVDARFVPYTLLLRGGRHAWVIAFGLCVPPHLSHSFLPMVSHRSFSVIFK
jgi:hypothetical protein